MIEIKNVSKKFGDQFVLKDIDLNIADGEQVLFVGQNGAGKSSLMRTILGEYIPQAVASLSTDLIHLNSVAALYAVSASCRKPRRRLS